MELYVLMPRKAQNVIKYWSMREFVRDKGRLEDIVEYSNNVLKIITGVDFKEFESNILVYYSTMKNIEIVGEATYMLTKEFKAEHDEIPWKQVEGMRHVLVHGYSQVLPKILWATAKEDIPKIKTQVEKYLKEIDWNKYTTRKKL